MPIEILPRPGQPVPQPEPPAPAPEPEPELPTPTPEPPKPTTPGIIFPTGTIKTPNLQGVPYGTPWADIARWEPWFTDATNDAGGAFGPLLLACFVVVESQGKHFTHNRTSGTDAEVIHGNADARSRGMLQIRHDLHDPQMRALQPREQIRLGANLLTRWMRETGSWEAALAQKWHPGTDPGSGIGPESYIRIIRDLIAEVKAVWPKEPLPTGDHPYEVMFGFLPEFPFGFRDEGGVGYPYGVGHGTTHEGQHTGDDLNVPFGTAFRSPGDGKVLCVGESGQGVWGQSCGFFRDTGQGGPNAASVGVGNITILFDTDHKAVFGHSRTCNFKAGDRVKAGDVIGTTGGMLGPHMHIEVAISAPEKVSASDRAQGITYWLVEPVPALREIMAGGGTTPGKAYTDHDVAGSTIPLRLPKGLAFRQQLTPKGIINTAVGRPNRSGLALRWTGTTQHSTGNTRTGTGAAMHANWQALGTQGHPDGVVAVHFYVDDKEVVQTLPINEQGIHSGDWRNQEHVAVELCVNADRNAARAEANAISLQAALLRILGKTGTQAMHPHTRNAQGHCPKLSVPWGTWEQRVDSAIGDL